MDELEYQAAGESPVEAQVAPEPSTPESATGPAPVEDPPAVASTPGEPEAPEEPPAAEAPVAPSDSEESSVTADELLAGDPTPTGEAAFEESQLKAVLEALVYVTEEPLLPAQIAAALQVPEARVHEILGQLVADFDRPDRGIHIKEVAGGYKMATKPEHHEAVRNFAKSLKPPLKLSLPALETLAVIAYKQPVTGPEIMEIRGVQGGGVLKTLLDRKLIAVAGRKNVIGKPMLYKTTREFLLQFGLKDLAELPSLKEFEEIRRMAFSDEPQPAEPPAAAAQSSPEPPPAPDSASEARAEAPPEAIPPPTPDAAPEPAPEPTAVSAPDAPTTEAAGPVPAPPEPEH